MKTTIGRTLIVLFLVATMVACEDDKLYELTITGSGKPIDGAIVSLYNDDNQTVRQTVKTGSDGIARLNVGDRTHVTLSIGYEVFQQKLINTFIKFPVSQTTLNSDTSFGCSNELGTMNITALNVAPETVAAEYLPSENSADLTMATAVTACEQNDGAVSQLLIGRDNLNTMTEYGFLKDVEFVNGGSYEIALDQSPTIIPWNLTTNGKLLVQAEYKGNPYYVNLKEGISGDIGFADQFFTGPYYVLAVWEQPDLEAVVISSYDTVPASLTYQIPDFDVVPQYNQDTDTWSVELTGNNTENVSIVQVVEVYETTTGNFASWIISSPKFDTLKRPELPNEMKAWIDPNNLSSQNISAAAGDSFHESDVLYATFGSIQKLTELDDFRFMSRPVTMTPNNNAAINSKTVTNTSSNKSLRILGSTIRK